MLKVFGGFEAADVVEHVKVSIGVDATSDQSVPVHALELDVGVVLLEVVIHEESEVNVWALDAVLVLSRHDELVEVKHLREHLHFVLSIYKFSRY